MAMVNEEFERAIVYHEDLVSTESRLIEKTNRERDERIRQIQADRRFAELIQTGLQEPKTSGTYALAMAYMRTFQKRHKPHGDLLVHQLLEDDDEKGGSEK